MHHFVPFARRIIILVCLLCGLTGCSPKDCATAAQDSPLSDASASNFVPEVLPPHLQFRVDVQLAALLPSAGTGAARGVVNRLKQWPPEIAPVRVCFFGGDAALRTRIITVASAWFQSPVGVALDFGPPAGRLCDARETNHVRVGFRYAGYWSLVGQDSFLLANQGEQSVNLQYFDVVTPPEPEFTRKVLHEFGHALGLEHEHQHPLSRCEQEFDWDRIYEYLGGSPNYWPKDMVDRQMRALTTEDLILSTFDKDSVMLYSFPSTYYKHGTESSCYTRANNRLSAGDRALLAQIYPPQLAEFAALRKQLVERYVDILADDLAVGLESELKAYTELQKLTQGELPSRAIASFSPDSVTLPNDIRLPDELKNVRPIT